MTEYSIRRLEPTDWLLYKSIRLLSLADSPSSFGGTYDQAAALPDTEWQARLTPHTLAGYALPLIAEARSGPIGLAWGLIREPEVKTAHVYQMWTSPAMRRNGIAKELLSRIVKWAINMNCDSLALDVTTTNQAAIKLYLSTGFVNSGGLAELREGSALNVQPMMLKLQKAKLQEKQ